jgi:hypothetical protein
MADDKPKKPESKFLEVARKSKEKRASMEKLKQDRAVNEAKLEIGQSGEE